MKKINNQILIFLLILYSILFILYKSEVISYQFLFASFISGAVNLANTAAAILAFNYASGKNNRQFLLYNLGGMVIRMFMLLIIIFIVLKFFNLDKFGFIFTFFVSYFIFLSIEINYFRLKVFKGNSTI